MDDWDFDPDQGSWANAVKYLEGPDEQLDAPDPTAYCQAHGCDPHASMAEAVNAHELIKSGG